MKKFTVGCYVTTEIEVEDTVSMDEIHSIVWKKLEAKGIGPDKDLRSYEIEDLESYVE